jgi:hypothetical protein
MAKYIGMVEPNAEQSSNNQPSQKKAQPQSNVIYDLLSGIGNIGAQGLHGLKEQGSKILGFPGYLQSTAPEWAKEQQARNFGGNEQAGYLPQAEWFLEKFGGAGPKPEGTLQETARRFGENLAITAPLALATGGASLVPAAAGAIGAQAGKEVGGEGWPEIIGGILGNTSANFVKNGFQGAFKRARQLGESAKNLNYNKVEKLTPDINVRTRDIGKKLLDIEKQAGEQLSHSGRATLSENYKDLEKIIKRPDVSLRNIWLEKKRWNDVINKLPADTTPKEYHLYNKVGDVLRDTLKEYGEKYPDFGNAFTKAEDLTTGLKAISTFREVLEESTDLKKMFGKGSGALGKLFLAGLGGAGYKFPIATAAGVGVGVPAAYSLRSAARGYDFFANSSEGKKLIAKAVQEASFGDKTGLAHTLNQVGKLFEEKSEEKPKAKYVGLID